MIKTGKIHLLFIVISILSISLHSIAYGVDFDASDTRIDLPGLSTPNNAVTPRMSIDQNGHVYVVWSDNRGGSLRIYINIFFPDRGWLPEAIPINAGPWPKGPSGGDATSPQVCSDNSGHIYVVWVDDRAVKLGTGKRDLYFRYSNDYGAHWYPEFTDYQIDSDSPESQIIGNSVNPRIACDEERNVYIVWQDDRNNGIYEVYFRSLQVPSSKPFDVIVPYQTPEVRLNSGVDAGKYQAINPAISTDKSGDVYVAWQDNRNIVENSIFPGIYFNVSKNHGASWSPAAVRIDKAPIYPFPPVNPVISSDSSGNVYVAWLDSAGRSGPGWGDEFAGDGTYDVYFRYSDDYGTTWYGKDRDKERDMRIDMPAKRVEAKDIAITNNNRGLVSIVWASNLEATTKGVSTNFNIYADHSEDFGKSFLDSESNIRIDTGVAPGVTNASTPLVQVDSLGDTFVTWVDSRSGTSDIYFNFSIEKGRKDTWQAGDIRLDYPVPSGDSINPVMSIDNLGHVFVAWQDSKSALAPGNYNIYFIGGFLDLEALLIAGQRLGEACFVATAAYGTPFERNVELLREFRDKYLLTNAPGRGFVSLYYRLSPSLAHFIVKHDYLKPAVRAALLPVVGITAVFVHTTTAQKIALFFVIVVLTGAASVILVRRKTF